MFEARDRKGELRAIAGGGRYDQLLETFGGEHQPCAGFGFGDAVIMELIKDKKLLPQLDHQVLWNVPLLYTFCVSAPVWYCARVLWLFCANESCCTDQQQQMSVHAQHLLMRPASL